MPLMFSNVGKLFAWLQATAFPHSTSWIKKTGSSGVQKLRYGNSGVHSTSRWCRKRQILWKTVAAILGAYPKLANNALLRNAMRKIMHPNLDIEEYSEDSDADDNRLRVPKGSKCRRTHPDNNFVVNVETSNLVSELWGIILYSYGYMP